jgi:hypothetical protein
LSGTSDGVGEALRRLRAEVGDIEFGYRAQGLFAHVLQRVGVSVAEIRNQGHPDIIGSLNGRLARFEIEIASKGDRHHVIKNDDVESIAPVLPNELGYLVVLDMAEPLRWAVMDYLRVRGRVGRAAISTLHAVADRDLSKACNVAFFEIIAESVRRLPALTFRLLCARVLRERAMPEQAGPVEMMMPEPPDDDSL